MVVLRLRPKGKKRQRTYRLVADEQGSKLDGKYIEDLGWVNRQAGEYELKEERVEYWLSVGAQPSDSVHNLLVREGILEGDKRPVHSTKKKSGESEEGEEAPEDVSEESEEVVDKDEGEEVEEPEPEEGDDDSEENEEEEPEVSDDESDEDEGEDEDSDDEDPAEEEEEEQEDDEEGEDDEEEE